MMKASKPQTVRRDNLAFLTTVIKEQGMMSQREIAEVTGLSVVTINKLIPELVEKEIIQEAAQAIVTGGRRAIAYTFNARHQLLLTIQLIEEKQQFYINFYVCDLYGTIESHEKQLGSSLSWIGIKDIIRQLVSQYPQIGAIAMGIPGVEKNGVSSLVDYPPLININLRAELGQEFGLPITIENDINAAVFGCATEKDAVDETLIGLYYPSEFPPGAGIVCNGKLVKGRNGFAGEVKYLPFPAFHQWNQVPVRTIDVESNISDVIQSMICLYDPAEIVIYTNNDMVTLEAVQRMMSHLAVSLPPLDLPDYQLSTDFNRDYLRGLIAQGLELLKEVEK
ncbi:ROK family transcriptional regulator [Vagococcus sp. BWB3-3]|uniref:ROK family transcriptional regulator n=1 Tax=Vagococcus allomyrinae TaxID=2794353 RepID=A0A940PBG6_9ENTE|nr:ROK family transcriptional regulator [Vagococcus allomyrinae]MBP1039638.1 ROK family transcriptional regulator [Vagococcus allomyrinae]